MAAKRILLLDSAGLTAYYWHGGHVRPEGEFHTESSGQEALGEYLRKHRSSVFYLLADVAEEGFQLEDIPYVQGGDRNALLQRRLSQYYYGTTLSLALSLGRAQEGRRDEKILFAALTRAEAFAPWLETLRSADAILAGVYSIPLLLTDCGAQWSGSSGPSLLINITRGGVRQSFFNQGKLQFSRLSQLATRGIDEIGIACAAESAKIHQYLIGQRQIPRGTVLPTRILAHRDQLSSLRGHCLNTNDIEFDFIDLADTARTEGFKDKPTDSRTETLFVHRLAAKTPRRQFAAAAERKLYHLWQARFALSSFAWIVLASCLIFSGKTALHVYELQQNIEKLTAQTAADNHRYKAILDGLPKVALTPDNLRGLIARYDELQKRNPNMAPTLLHLSHALTEMPKIDLVRIDWKTGGESTVGAANTPQTAATTVVSGGPVLDSLDVTAQLPLGLTNDLRAQLALLEAFTARLRSAQFDVRITSMPFEIESAKPLRSRVEQLAAQNIQAPKFSLRIIRKP
jgi:hypothetical protein